jgi:predicted dehydrogenase
MHWRENRTFSGNNILALGIWYEAVMRWIGTATEVSAMGKTFVPFRTDEGMGRVTDIPDHLDVTASMGCGAQLHMQLSGVTGVGGTAEAFLFGTDGTLRFSGGKLFGAARGDDQLQEIQIPAEEKASWRVEEEFIGAIRGNEEIKLTDFATGVQYMEFIDAVTISIKNRRVVGLPLG